MSSAGRGSLACGALMGVAALLLGIAAPAEAQAREGERVASPSDFWRAVHNPSWNRAQRLLRQAVVLRGAAFMRDQRTGATRGAHEQAALIERAIVRLERALELVPGDAEILYELALTLLDYDDPSTAGPDLDDEAIATLHALRAADPSYRAEDVAFNLGVLHTRGERFADAAREYQVTIDLGLSAGVVIPGWSNLAEVTMLAGEVERAVSIYERAIEEAREAGDNADLALWGLAVALDRIGEHRRAVHVAGEALAIGGGETTALHQEGVFFVPRYEVWWYEGLAAEAQVAQAASEDERRTARTRAITSFRHYLDQGGDQSRWADLAERRVTELEAEREPTASGARGGVGDR